MRSSIADQFANRQAHQLLAFLIAYAEAHNNLTPTLEHMGREINSNTGTVKSLLNQLERDGKIMVVSWNGDPRIILKVDDNTSLPSSLKGRDEKRYDRFLDAEARRQSIGRYIGDTYAKQGRGPTLREIMNHIGTTDQNWAYRQTEMLKERGLVNFGQGIPTTLTELGRQFYGFKDPSQPKENTKVTQQVVVPIRTATPASEAPVNLNPTDRRPVSHKGKGIRQFVSPNELLDKVGRYLYSEFIAGRKLPSQKELHTILDLPSHRISEALRTMVAAGYVGGFAGDRVMNYTLTEAGLERFGPSKVETPALAEPVAAAPVEPVDEPAPEPVVETPQAEPARPPEPVEAPATSSFSDTVLALALKNADLIDLVNELAERGYKVIRR